MRLGAVGFVATVALMVPAGWRLIDADREGYAALYRPDVHKISVSGAEVAVAVDQGMVEAGGKVRVTLVATAATPTKVPLAIIVEEQQGAADSRVDEPPLAIARENVTIMASAKGTTKELTFTLRGDRKAGRDLSGAGGLRQYTILVEPAGMAGLEKRRAAELAAEYGGGYGGSSYGGYDEAMWTAYNAEFEEGRAARMTVMARTPEAYRVTIEKPALVHAGEPFTATVRVKNVSKRTLEEVRVDLMQAYGLNRTENYDGEDGEGDDDDEKDTFTITLPDGEDALYLAELAPGAEATFALTVTPDIQATEVALLARGYAETGGAAADVARVPVQAAPDLAQRDAHGHRTFGIW